MKTMRARKPDNAVADRAFSSGVLTRDGRVCRMQRWDGKIWREHGIKGSDFNPIDPVHIYSRARIANDAVHFNALIGLAGCRSCHDAYDDKLGAEAKDLVRVPPERERTAWRYLERQKALGVLTLLPSRREPHERPAA